MGLVVTLIYVPDSIGFPVGVILCAARVTPLVVTRVGFSKRIVRLDLSSPLDLAFVCLYLWLCVYPQLLVWRSYIYNLLLSSKTTTTNSSQ
jgi:hypothetical protein